MNENVNKNVNEDVNEDVNENDDDDDDDDNDREIRRINHCFKTIDKSESFENQIKLFKKVDYLCEFKRYYDDDKEINLKIFKLKLAPVSNDVDKNLFEEVFGHAFVTLANKLINTTSKEENQIIINDLKKNRDKLYERDFVIQKGSKGVDLIDAVKVILESNETIQLDGD